VPSGGRPGLERGLHSIERRPSRCTRAGPGRRGLGRETRRGFTGELAGPSDGDTLDGLGIESSSELSVPPRRSSNGTGVTVAAGTSADGVVCSGAALALAVVAVAVVVTVALADGRSGEHLIEARW